MLLSCVIAFFALSSEPSSAQNVAAPILVQLELINGNALFNPPSVPYVASVEPFHGAIKVLVQGTFKNSDGSYLLNYRPLTVKPPGDRIGFFHLLDREITDFRLSHIKLDGNIEHSIYRLKVLGWHTVKNQIDAASTPWSFSFGLGPSLLNYSQTNSAFNSLSRTALTVKLGTQYRFKGTPWVLGALGFVNALSITPTTTTNPLFRFLGLNLRGGRQISGLTEPWELSLFMGWYYLTMMTDGSFGFSNVMGPQIYPVIKRKFANGSNGSGYIKFSPISRKLGFFGLSNYELATGINYLFPKTSRLQWGVALDGSMLTLTTTDTTDQTTKVTSSSITLSGTVSY